VRVGGLAGGAALRGDEQQRLGGREERVTPSPGSVLGDVTGIGECDADRRERGALYGIQGQRPDDAGGGPREVPPHDAAGGAEHAARAPNGMQPGLRAERSLPRRVSGGRGHELPHLRAGHRVDARGVEQTQQSLALRDGGDPS